MNIFFSLLHVINHLLIHARGDNISIQNKWSECSKYNFSRKKIRCFANVKTLLSHTYLLSDVQVNMNANEKIQAHLTSICIHVFPSHCSGIDN